MFLNQLAAATFSSVCCTFVTITVQKQYLADGCFVMAGCELELPSFSCLMRSSSLNVSGFCTLKCERRLLVFPPLASTLRLHIRHMAVSLVFGFWPLSSDSNQNVSKRVLLSSTWVVEPQSLNHTSLLLLAISFVIARGIYRKYLVYR